MFGDGLLDGRQGAIQITVAITREAQRSDVASKNQSGVRFGFRKRESPRRAREYSTRVPEKAGEQSTHEPQEDAAIIHWSDRWFLWLVHILLLVHARCILGLV